MAQVIVRHLDDNVVSDLKTKANLHGRSLEQELRDILTRSAPLTPAERVELSSRYHAMAPVGVRQTDSTLLIREDRDTR